MVVIINFPEKCAKLRFKSLNNNYMKAYLLVQRQFQLQILMKILFVMAKPKHILES